jgi:hypothetical protein
LLFDYKWKERLYQIPYATYALEDYDISNPDFEKFPALDGVEGIECFLEHGDTLFMPTGWWHWMEIFRRKFLYFSESLGQILGCKSSFSLESYGSKKI